MTTLDPLVCWANCHANMNDCRAVVKRISASTGRFSVMVTGCATIVRWEVWPHTLGHQFKGLSGNRPPSA
jgi:hypothetical protein